MSTDPWKHARKPGHGDGEASTPAERKSKELRLHGLNAVQAVFKHTPERIRKVYLSEARVPAMRELLKWCAQQRVGYRVVEEADLAKLAQTTHHEGIVADVVPPRELALHEWLSNVAANDTVCALWLDHVGNPHNLGAMMRNAAHFGIAALLVEADTPSPVSGAAARVAEGGAERVAVVRLPVDAKESLKQLKAAGFQLVATPVQGGDSLFQTELPARTVYVMGAEQHGVSRGLLAACDQRVSIPGTGDVESLNVASASAVLLAAWRMQHRG